MTLEKFTNEMKIKKKWKFNNEGWTIEVNDSSEHNILDRIKDRTDLGYNVMNKKFQKGVDYLIKKSEFFKQPKAFVELKYKKSDFKVIFMIKTKNKYIRISSVFISDMETQGAYYWKINEFKEQFPELKTNLLYDFSILDLNDGDKMFAVESINESKEIYLNDLNEVIKLELEE